MITKQSNPQKSKEWKERLEEFAKINEMYIRGFPMSKLEALISQLLSTQKADLKRELEERVSVMKKDVNEDVWQWEKIMKNRSEGEFLKWFSRIISEMKIVGSNETLQKVKEEIEKL